jgi:hypothetical protein
MMQSPNYYFNPYFPDGIIISSGRCPCQDDVLVSFVTNFNGYFIVNSDNSPIVSDFEYIEKYTI